MPRINTDEILREFGDWRNHTDVMKAGKIAVMRLKKYFLEGISFNQETTLCGRSIFRNIRKAHECGYKVEIYFVGLESAELAKERVAKRVLAGGHGIPDADVERRYLESLKNLKELILVCDLVVLYDNTTEFRRFAIYKSGKCVAVSRTVPEWYRDFIGKE